MKPSLLSVIALCLLVRPAHADDLLFFRTPSKNIGCMIATGDYAVVRCDLRDLTPSTLPAPVDCDLDWGHSFEIGLSDRKGYLACVGDSVFEPTAITLGYGETISLGGFACTSEKTGMTCTNPAGHGFTIAKARQKLF